MSLAPSDGSRLWHGDITSPFPPSGNEGYIRNRDVPYLSVTTSYVVMTSVTDKELLRASEAPGAVHVYAQCSYGTQQRQGWVCLLRSSACRFTTWSQKGVVGTLGTYPGQGLRTRESSPARTQGTLRSPKMLGGPRPFWWKWARSGALS